MTKSPKEIVIDFISRANQLYDVHAPAIKDASDKDAKMRDEDKDLSDPQRAKTHEQKWALIKDYKLKHKELCEEFGIAITNNNFSEGRYDYPCQYKEHEVINVEQKSSKKARVFTKMPTIDYNTNMVFTLALKQEQWVPTKLHYFDSDGKESGMEW